jgi:hypothetical protein
MNTIWNTRAAADIVLRSIHQEIVMRKILFVLTALGAFSATGVFAQTGSAGSGSGGTGSAGSTMQTPAGRDSMTPTGRSDSSTSGNPSPAPRNGSQAAPKDDQSRGAPMAGTDTGLAPKDTDSAPPSKTAPGPVQAPK